MLPAGLSLLPAGSLPDMVVVNLLLQVYRPTFKLGLAAALLTPELCKAEAWEDCGHVPHKRRVAKGFFGCAIWASRAGFVAKSHPP